MEFLKAFNISIAPVIDLTVFKKLTSPSCLFDSVQDGSAFFNIITASITISTLAGGRVNDLISERSFLFNASRA